MNRREDRIAAEMNSSDISKGEGRACIGSVQTKRKQKESGFGWKPESHQICKFERWIQGVGLTWDETRSAEIQLQPIGR